MSNMVLLHGHVGKAPEEKTTTSGKKFARFSFATTESWRDTEGNKKSKTEWHSIIAWGPLGDRVMKGISKGKELNLVGKIEYTPMPDPANPGKNKGSYTNIKLTTFEYCGKKNDGDGGSNTPDPDPGRDADVPDTPLDNDVPLDDEIPF
jgi:single-strand DNA-binding protein